jgi:hypothetical protein
MTQPDFHQISCETVHDFASHKAAKWKIGSFVCLEADLKIVSERKGAEKQRRKGIFMFDCAPQGHGHCFKRANLDAEARSLAEKKEQVSLNFLHFSLRTSASLRLCVKKVGLSSSFLAALCEFVKY